MSEFVNDFLCPAPSAGSDVPLDVEKREAGVDTMAAGFRAPKNEAHP